MRIKSFVAATVGDAMRQIRNELGDDAVIVSTQSGEHGEGVRVTAALDSPDAESELENLLAADEKRGVEEPIQAALTFHGMAPRARDVLIELAGKSGSDDPVMALSAALKAQFRFTSLSLPSITRPLMMIGPPGVGKTIAVAKLATRAALANRTVKVICADPFKAGAVHQLTAFTDIIESTLVHVDSPSALSKAIKSTEKGTLIFIDSSGTNPFSTSEMATLAQFIAAHPIEPVLVTAAGGDVEEAAEIAEAFRAVGARRFVLTRLDMTRRLGAALVTASAGPLSYSEVSISPHVARGLTALTPKTLARLLMRDPHRVESKSAGREAAQ